MLKRKPELRISLLNIDIDFNESTCAVLKHCMKKVSHGGIILLDNYGHTNGDTQSVDNFFKEIGVKPKIQRFSHSNRPCFIIKINFYMSQSIKNIKDDFINTGIIEIKNFISKKELVEINQEYRND